MTAACRAAGREPRSIHLSVAQVVCCGRDESEIARRAASIGRQVENLRTDGLCGTPDEVMAKLSDYAGVGASRVYLQVLDLHDLDHLALIAESILPRCAAL